MSLDQTSVQILRTVEWPARRLRRLFLDMHLPDWTRRGQSGGTLSELRGVATHFDPDELVAYFLKARADVVVLFAKCQYGNFYYNTTIGHKHTGLGSRDFLGELIARAHAHNMRVVAYYSNGWDVEIARAHPEWMARDEAGRFSYARWPRLCFNSPYRELVQTHLDELFRTYELDGIWMDMLHVLPCYCARCDSIFERRFGQKLPRRKADSAWLEMVHWQHEVLKDYILRARSTVKLARPGATFVINFYASPYASPSNGLSARHLEYCDYGSMEGYSEWHGVLFPSYAARYLRALMPGKSFEVLISRFVRTWDFTLRPAEQMKFEAFSVAANGGAVCLDDEPYHDGRVESLVYDALGEVYEQVREREPYLLGAQPIYYAGLYHSWKTREVAELLAGDVSASGGDAGNDFYGFSLERLQAPADIVLSTQGLFKALIESHVPLDFLFDEGLSQEQLSRFRVILLPNVIAMDEQEADSLREYVARGGGVVATGATSLYRPDGTQRTNFLLSDMFGVDYMRVSPFRFAYLQFLPDVLDCGVGHMPLAHYRPVLEVRPNRGVQVGATLLEPIIDNTTEAYYHNNQPAPHHPTGIPTVIRTHFGRGRVAYISGEPEANYAVLGHAPYRRLIRNSAIWAAGGPFEIMPHVPLNTEVTYQRLQKSIVVHFVTGWPSKRVAFHKHKTDEAIEESFAVANVRIDMPSRISSALFLPGGQSLLIHREGAQAYVTLPAIQRWETLVLEEGGRS